MPHTSDEHAIDIRSSRSLKKTRPISRWRNQINSRSVDLRAFAPKKQQLATPIKQKQTSRETPAPILAVSPDPQQQEQASQIFSEARRLTGNRQTARDELLQEFEKIEQEHIQLQNAIGAPAFANELSRSEYAPWTSIENKKIFPDLSLFAPSAALRPKRSVNRRTNLIPEAQHNTSKASVFASKQIKEKRGTARGFVGCVVVLLFLIFGVSIWQRSQGVEGRVVPQVLQAYGDLEQAKADLTALHFTQASSEFSSAEEKFSNAQSATESVGGHLLAQAVAAAPLPNKARSGIRLIAAGREFSRAGADISHAAFLLTSVNQGTSAQLSTGATQSSFSSVFAEAMRELSDAQTNITLAQSDLAYVRIEDIPQNYQAQFSDSLARLSDANSIFQSVGQLSDALMTLAGMQSPKTYLLLFQNSAEIRATGGFLGTYGILKLNQGQIKSITADGTYNVDGQLTANIVPPYPVEYISTGWSMHDANWFFDFPTSAQKVTWFYEKTGGETPDGVIAITPQLVEDLLKITGPIAMPAYNTTLSADNFEDIVQQQVEVSYDKTQNKPKQILADFMPVLFARVQGDLSAHAGDIAQMLMRSLQKKDILLYSRDQNVEQVFDAQGWSGRVAVPASGGAQDVQDVLGVVQTNLGGYKTDRVTRTTMQTQTTVESDGSIHRTVTVTRTHQGGKSIYDWYNKPNVDYMRIYVPQGSKLVQTNGFSPQPAIPLFDYHANNFSTDETVAATGLGDKKDPASNTDIFQENGMRVFGNWLVLNPGETKTVQFEYVLPTTFSAPSSYTLSLFSQAGITPVLGVSLDFSSAGTISSCSQGTYDAHTITFQKVAFSTNTKVTCVVGR